MRIQSLSRAALALALVASANAQTTTWCIEATGAEEVPPVATPAVAQGIFTLDHATNTLTWAVTHQNTNGNLNVSHIHGPAGIGVNGGVQISLGFGANPTGSAVLNANQVNWLQTGQLYMNLHTQGHPSGELRGQIDDTCEDVLCAGDANSAHADGARLMSNTTYLSYMPSNNSLTFHASQVPANQFGMLVIGSGTTQVNPPGSSGTLCIAGAPLGRFNGDIQHSGSTGTFNFTPNILSLPNPPGGAINSGDTWNFQAWYRDVGGTSNFTDAKAIHFL